MLIFGGSLISFLGRSNLYENGPILDEKKEEKLRIMKDLIPTTVRIGQQKHDGRRNNIDVGRD